MKDTISEAQAMSNCMRFVSKPWNYKPCWLGHLARLVRENMRKQYCVRCTMLYKSVQYLLPPCHDIPPGRSNEDNYSWNFFTILFHPVPIFIARTKFLIACRRIGTTTSCQAHMVGGLHMFKAWIITNASWGKCQGNPDLIRS